MGDARASRRVTISLGVTQTIGFAGSFYLPAILAAPMADDLRLSPAAVFAGVSGALLLHAFLSARIGRWVDKVGGRVPLAVASCVLGAGLVILAASASALQMYLAWAILGLGMALGLYDVAFAALVGWYRQAARPAITGVTLIAGFASTIGWPLTAWLEAEFGWRAACLAWAALHVGVALPLHLGLPRRPGLDAPADAPATPERHEPSAAGQTLPMILLAIAFTAFGVIASAISAHLPPLLTGLGVAATAAVAAGALIGPAQVAARLGEHVLMRNVHPLTSARVAALLFPAGAVAALVFGSGMAPLLAILYGCGNGLYTIARGTLPLTLFGADGYGARLGLISMPSRFVGAVTPWLIAGLATASPRNALELLMAVGLVGFAALIALRAQRHNAAA